MEEKKEIKKVETEITEKENTVKMNPNQQEKLPRNIEEEFDSMTKNKLKEVAGQLYYQNQQLMNRIKNMDMTNIFRRFDYLFKGYTTFYLSIHQSIYILLVLTLACCKHFCVDCVLISLGHRSRSGIVRGSTLIETAHPGQAP